METLLDPAGFFRANRQFVVALRSIGVIYPASYGKLNVTLQGYREGLITVSRERAGDFMRWLEE